MLQKLKKQLESLNIHITPTTDNKNQFEMNVRNGFMCEKLHANIETLEIHHGYIGKEVYKYQKNFSVVTIDDYVERKIQDQAHYLFNPIEETSFVYSEDDYNVFEDKYIRFQIEHISKELVNNSPYSNSTNPFSNLEHQWIVESKQKLVSFFDELLITSKY